MKLLKRLIASALVASVLPLGLIGCRTDDGKGDSSMENTESMRVSDPAESELETGLGTTDTGSGTEGTSNTGTTGNGDEEPIPEEGFAVGSGFTCCFAEAENSARCVLSPAIPSSVSLWRF